MVWLLTPLYAHRRISFMSPLPKRRKSCEQYAREWKEHEEILKAQEEVCARCGDPGQYIMDYLYSDAWNDFGTPYKK